MRDAYMGAPWTRDGTVRAYVVTMAPEVAGHIVELPVVDRGFRSRASASPVAATAPSAGPGVPRNMRSLRSEDI